ncbi:S8 family serine peptidase [Streptomyces sp. NPDC018833]|uniref:S8 family serine peptidase n=1 Tax=Streptomyces sp. NPDC018833 TaxID=3365053 RepID=UPI0037AF78E2
MNVGMRPLTDTPPTASSAYRAVEAVKDQTGSPEHQRGVPSGLMRVKRPTVISIFVPGCSVEVAMRLLVRRSRVRTGMAAGLVAAVLSVGFSAPSAQAKDPVSRWIVVFKDSVPDPGKLATAQAAPYRAKVNHVYDVAAGGQALKGYTVDATAEQIAAIRTDPRVDFIEPDRVEQIPEPPKAAATTTGHKPPPGRHGRGGVPFAGDPLRAEQWGLFQIGASTATRVPSPPRVGVANLDTGADLNHPDLRVAGALNFSDSPTAGDLNGHGTHVAGIIQAPNNGIGVVGVAPGVKLWSVKVVNDDESFEFSDVAAGLAWVTHNAKAKNIRVANIEVATATDSPVLRKAVQVAAAAGVILVAAAGNFGTTQLQYPAAYPELLAVAATDQDNQRADFSSYGANWVDIAAPGVDIWSTGPTYPNSQGLLTYDTLSGTSQAAPFVAATVVLCLYSGHCKGDYRRVFDRIGRDSLPIAGTGTEYRYGLVQATCYWQKNAPSCRHR